MSLSRFQLQFHGETGQQHQAVTGISHRHRQTRGIVERDLQEASAVLQNHLQEQPVHHLFHHPVHLLPPAHRRAERHQSLFKGKNMISENSTGLLSVLLRVGRRLEVKPCEHDKRQLRYKPTPHALAETGVDRLHGAALSGAGATDAHRDAAGGARLSAHLFRRLRAADAQGST